MQDLDRLQLFPAVFAMPPGQEEQLSTSYGSRGVQLMDAAEQLLGSWQPAVLPLSLLLCLAENHWLLPCLTACFCQPLISSQAHVQSRRMHSDSPGSASEIPECCKSLIGPVYTVACGFRV